MAAHPSLLGLARATLERSEFQKPINNTLFIQQFVNEQKSYAIQYLKDGTRIFEQWKGNDGGRSMSMGGSVESNTCAPSVNSLVAPSEQIFALSSPLLQPRVPHLPLDTLDAAGRLPPSKLKNSGPLVLADPPTVHNPEKSRKERAQRKRKTEPSGPPHYLDEYEFRLMERRERRRAKRAITSPPNVPVALEIASNHINSSSSTSSDGRRIPQRSLLPPPKNSKKRYRSPEKKYVPRQRAQSFNQKAPSPADVDKENTPSERSPPKEKKKGKLAPGLALMQNFQPKNIGRERITLKATSKVGVFNKGVASVRTNVSRKKKIGNRQAQNQSGKHAIFNEEAFLNRTRQPKVLPSCSLSPSISPSDGSQNSALEHPKAKRGRPSQPGAAPNTRIGSRDSKKSTLTTVSNHEIPAAKPNTDRVSRFFRKCAPDEKLSDTPAALERSRRISTKGRERYSSPSWEIDWTAEGLPAPPSQPSCPQEEPQLPIKPCKDDAIDTTLPGKTPYEDPASVSSPVVAHDIIEADSRLEDASYLDSARPPESAVEPLPRQMTSTELRFMNGMGALQLDTHTTRCRPCPISSNAFHLTAPAMQTYQGVDGPEPEVCRDLQQITEDEWPPEELNYRHILSNTRIQSGRQSLASESGSSMAKGRSTFGVDYDPSYALSRAHSFDCPSHSPTIHGSARPIPSQFVPLIYGVLEERTSEYQLCIDDRTGQRFYSQENADDCSSGSCEPETYQPGGIQPSGEGSVSEAADELNLREMNTSPQLIASVEGDGSDLFDFVKQRGPSRCLSYQENEECQEPGVRNCGVFKRDFDVTIEPYPYSRNCDGFNAPTSANSSPAPDKHTTDAHGCLTHQDDTSIPRMKSPTFHAARMRSPLPLSRSPSPPNSRTINYAPFQQGRALLGIEAVSRLYDVHLRRESLPDNPEHADQDNSILHSVVQELERNGYWGSGDARRCR